MKNIRISGHGKLIVSVVFLLISAGLFAQTNFAGTWAYNESKSNFGESQFRFAATTMVVTQDAKVLSVESTMPGRDGGETKSTAKYNLDGTVSENPMFNTTRKSTVTWSADKASLTMAHTMTFDMNGETRTMNSSETWKLSEEGKVLLITNARTGPDGAETKTTVAYDKK
ncbi:MAG: hypothetical protein NT092_02105 [Bacteroidia bacterium]|nr:hypothetical protein [Bacteroidia bacterium]